MWKTEAHLLIRDVVAEAADFYSFQDEDIHEAYCVCGAEHGSCGEYTVVHAGS